MAVKEIRRLIEEGLSNPELSLEDASLLRQMHALDRRNALVRGETAERDERLSDELKVIEETVGVPVGELLVERGISARTKVLEAIPSRLQVTGKRGIGILGEFTGEQKGRNLWDLDLSRTDRALVVRALNGLYGLARYRVQDLKMDVVFTMDMRTRARNVGPHGLAVLRGIASQLQKPA